MGWGSWVLLRVEDDCSLIPFCDKCTLFLVKAQRVIWLRLVVRKDRARLHSEV